MRKPAVRRELRRQWLRRYEEDGESPPKIASADGYDVRTVRKQIELERQERERREARATVLRQALEQHYADLCAFARKLDLEVTAERGTLKMLQSDPMWSALREHLPRSAMWRGLDRWERLVGEIEELMARMEKRFEELASSRSGLKFSEAMDEVGLNRGIVPAMASHSRAVAQEEPGLDERVGFKSQRVDERTVRVALGAYGIATVPDDRVTEVQNLVRGLLAEITTWEGHDDLRRLLAELKRVREAVHDELLLVTLRRVVPGRCRYCPV